MTKNKQDAKADSDAETAPTVNRSAPMWKVVEKASAQNKLQDLRDGRLRRSQKVAKDEADGHDGSLPLKKSFVKTVKETSKQKKMKTKPAAEKNGMAKTKAATSVDANMDEDDDDDETGTGFFE